MVGVDPTTSALSAQHSAVELHHYMVATVEFYHTSALRVRYTDILMNVCNRHKYIIYLTFRCCAVISNLVYKIILLSLVDIPYFIFYRPQLPHFYSLLVLLIVLLARDLALADRIELPTYRLQGDCTPVVLHQHILYGDQPSLRI